VWQEIGLAELAGQQQFLGIAGMNRLAPQHVTCPAALDQNEEESSWASWTRLKGKGWNTGDQPQAPRGFDELQDGRPTAVPDDRQPDGADRQARQRAVDDRAIAQLEGDSSIISEAAPSELAAEFGETRIQPESDESASSGLPVIGNWPAARQQRALFALFLFGLALLLTVALTAVITGGRASSQVAAAGQAQTQSQRLAKSVSQALLGGTAGVPRRAGERFDAWRRNVRSLKAGVTTPAAAPSMAACRMAWTRSVARWSTAPRRARPPCSASRRC
jgi:hypothetical protein